MARQLASARKLTSNPNLKLRRVLERRGFVVREPPGRSSAYHFIDMV
ncbi:hypothetical protein [Myxococcus qinghaiensis]|nr:hypothetical protein [Myxococcus qinghaiensis]MCP3168946.1 hypothetical protein [Myxococcus qinghaiensis]